MQCAAAFFEMPTAWFRHVIRTRVGGFVRDSQCHRVSNLVQENALAVQADHAVEVQFDFAVGDAAQAFDQTVGLVVGFTLAFDVLQ